MNSYLALSLFVDAYHIFSNDETTESMKQPFETDKSLSQTVKGLADAKRFKIAYPFRAVLEFRLSKS